jgi:hypothetical protein
VNRLGHFGYLLLWVGQGLLTQGESIGWLIRLTGEGIWLFIGVRMRMNSIWLWGGVGIAVEVFGFLSWTGRI